MVFSFLLLDAHIVPEATETQAAKCDGVSGQPINGPFAVTFEMRLWFGRTC